MDEFKIVIPVNPLDPKCYKKSKPYLMGLERIKEKCEIKATYYMPCFTNSCTDFMNKKLMEILSGYKIVGKKEETEIKDAAIITDKEFPRIEVAIIGEQDGEKNE